MRKEIGKLVTAVMAFSMVLSLPAFPQNVHAEDSQAGISDEEEMKNTIEAYLHAEEWMPVTDTDRFMIQKSVINPDPLELLEYNAWMASGETCKVHDINGDGVYELFTGFSGDKVSVYEYDQVTLESGKKLKALKTMKNVKEIRYMEKKTVTFKQVSGKKTTYTTYKITSGKLKAAVTYTKNGTTYQKNTGKIKKAAFNKYVTSYKKQKKLTLQKITGEADLYVAPRDYNELRMEKDQAFGFTYWNSSSFVFNKDTGNAEDTYQMFWSSMNAEIAPIRYILGPNVSAPEKDTTYQHLDWVANLQYYYDNLLKEDENNHRSVLEILHDLSFTVTGNDLGNGCKEYKAVPKFSDGTSANYWYDVLVNTAGGSRLTRIDVTYDTGVSPVVWNFSYDEDAVYDGQYADPLSFAFCYPQSDADTRSITVDYAGTERKILVSSGVQFDLPMVLGSGGFSVINTDGTSFDPMADSTLPSGETFYEVLNKEKDESGKTYANVETILHWKAD